MTKGRPVPDIVRQRIIQLLLSAAHREGELMIVSIAERFNCSKGQWWGRFKGIRMRRIPQ